MLTKALLLKYDLGVAQAFYGNQAPTQTRRDQNTHGLLRQFDVSILQSRTLEDIQRGVEAALDDALNSLCKNKGKLSTLEAAMCIGNEVSFQCFAESKSPVGYDECMQWGSCLTKVHTNSWMSNVCASALYHMKAAGVHGIIDKYNDAMLTSPLWPQFRKLADDLLQHNARMDDQDLALHLSYLTGFNGAFAMGFMLNGVFGHLDNRPKVLQALREELGKTRPNMDNIDSFPLLESFAVEVQRTLLRPTAMFRQAQKSFLLPCGNGKQYRVKKGEVLFAFNPTAQRDPDVFPYPNQFDAWRYIKHPAQKDKVWQFGWVPGTTFVCVCVCLCQCVCVYVCQCVCVCQCV